MKLFTKKNNRTSLVKWMVYVAFPLAAGAAFYRYLRPNHAAIFGKGQVFDAPLPSIVAQSLPSLLWSFALTAAFLLIWGPTAKLTAFYIAGFTALVSILFEIWQAADIGTGTFDWKDCLFSVAGCLISLFTFHKTNLY